MKTIEDIKLEDKISDMILEVIGDVRAGKMDEVDDGDLAGICEALAMNIIKIVKEAA